MVEDRSYSGAVEPEEESDLGCDQAAPSVARSSSNSDQARRGDSLEPRPPWTSTTTF